MVPVSTGMVVALAGMTLGVRIVGVGLVGVTSLVLGADLEHDYRLRQGGIPENRGSYAGEELV